MIRAVVREGVIHPLAPLPDHWADGQELEIEEAGYREREAELETWSQDAERLTAKIPPEDFERLDAELSEADSLAKEYVKRQMGL